MGSMDFLSKPLEKLIENYNGLDKPMQRLIRWVVRAVIIILLSFSCWIVSIAYYKSKETKIIYKSKDTCINKPAIHDTFVKNIPANVTSNNQKGGQNAGTIINHQ